jgi:flagellar hook assembly protein FlgD
MTLHVSLAAPREAQFDIYTMSGELVRSFTSASATDHDVLWDLRDASHHRVPTGVYVLRITAGSATTATTVQVVP